MQIHPNQPAKASAQFTLAGAPGKFQGAARWVDEGGKAVFSNQVDDPANGTTNADVDFSAYGDGENTKLKVDADGDLGPKVNDVAAESEQIDFSIAAVIGADAAQIAVNQPAA